MSKCAPPPPSYEEAMKTEDDEHLAELLAKVDITSDEIVELVNLFEKVEFNNTSGQISAHPVDDDLILATPTVSGLALLVLDLSGSMYSNFLNLVELINALEQGFTSLLVVGFTTEITKHTLLIHKPIEGHHFKEVIYGCTDLLRIKQVLSFMNGSMESLWCNSTGDNFTHVKIPGCKSVATNTILSKCRDQIQQIFVLTDADPDSKYKAVGQMQNKVPVHFIAMWENIPAMKRSQCGETFDALFHAWGVSNSLKCENGPKYQVTLKDTIEKTKCFPQALDTFLVLHGDVRMTVQAWEGLKCVRQSGRDGQIPTMYNLDEEGKYSINDTDAPKVALYILEYQKGTLLPETVRVTYEDKDLEVPVTQVEKAKDEVVSAVQTRGIKRFLRNEKEALSFDVFRLKYGKEIPGGEIDPELYHRLVTYAAWMDLEEQDPRFEQWSQDIQNKAIQYSENKKELLRLQEGPEEAIQEGPEEAKESGVGRSSSTMSTKDQAKSARARRGAYRSRKRRRTGVCLFLFV